MSYHSKRVLLGKSLKSKKVEKTHVPAKQDRVDFKTVMRPKPTVTKTD